MLTNELLNFAVSNDLKTVLEIPCGKDLYFDRYRRFYWLLDKRRD